MQWFSNLMEGLGVECLIGEMRILKLLAEERFPAIWLPSKELQDLRALLRHRHQWVRMPTRVQSPGEWPPPRHCLWSHDGQRRIASLSLAPHSAYRRSELQWCEKSPAD